MVTCVVTLVFSDDHSWGGKQPGSQLLGCRCHVGDDGDVGQVGGRGTEE